MDRLILASASPRRAQMLRDAGIEFDVRVADVDESPRAGESPSATALRLAEAKARAVDGDLVLGADTLLDLDGRVLGKPRDDEDARAILRSLQGRSHVVITSVALRRGDRVLLGFAQTRVRFRSLSEDEIAAYVATGEPRGKAGAYAIQGKAGAALVASVEGPVDNVIGLPMGVVLSLLSAAARRTTEDTEDHRG